MEQREFDYSFNYSMTQAKIEKDLVRYAPSEWTGVKELQKINEDLEKRHLDTFVDLKFGLNWLTILIIIAICIVVLAIISLGLYFLVVRKRVRNLIAQKKFPLALF